MYTKDCHNNPHKCKKSVFALLSCIFSKGCQKFRKLSPTSHHVKTSTKTTVALIYMKTNIILSSLLTSRLISWSGVCMTRQFVCHYWCYQDAYWLFSVFINAVWPPLTYITLRLRVNLRRSEWYERAKIHIGRLAGVEDG